MKNQPPPDLAPVPNHFIYYGYGPLKVQAVGDQKLDVVGIDNGDITWTKNLIGWAKNTRYALRKGSEIARLNGLENLPLPDGVSAPPDNTLFFGMGPLKVEAADSRRKDVFVFSGGCWTCGWRGNSSFYYALRKNSEIAKLNGLTENKTETAMKTQPKMKLKLQVLTDWEIQTPKDMVAFRIVEQDGFESTKIYSANGYDFQSVFLPDFDEGFHPRTRFYLRGNDKDRDNRIMVIPRVKYDKLVAAIDSLLKAENTPVLYTATFFYKNEKNGSQKRRMIEVLKEDATYLEGNDKDDNGSYKKFLKANVIGTIDKIK